MKTVMYILLSILVHSAFFFFFFRSLVTFNNKTLTDVNETHTYIYVCICGYLFITKWLNDIAIVKKTELKQSCNNTSE